MDSVTEFELGLGEGTKALGVLLLGPKEYHALGRLHSLPSKEKLENILDRKSTRLNSSHT